MITIDRRTIRAARDGKPLTLTPTEFKILAALADDPGRVYSREQLLTQAFGYSEAVAERLETRTTDAHIYRLRKKLGPGVIRCADGFGYALEPDTVEVAA